VSGARAVTKLPAEGFYSLRKSLTFEGGEWPKGALVQLGYTKNGDPILFIGQVRAQLQENDLFFSDRGVGVSRQQLAILEKVEVFQEPAPAGGQVASEQQPVLITRNLLAARRDHATVGIRAALRRHR